MPQTYTWEVQRCRYGNLWSHQDQRDPRGAEPSDLTAEDFARDIAHRHLLASETDPWRVVVWDQPGVGRLPIATITSDQPSQ